jgi:hypothetical protein
MEKLNTIYNNFNYDDNTILVRILNTILENDKSENSIHIIKYFIFCKIIRKFISQ